MLTHRNRNTSRKPRRGRRQAARRPADRRFRFERLEERQMLAGMPSLSINDVQQLEGTGSTDTVFEFTVTRSGKTTGTSSVGYYISGGAGDLVFPDAEGTLSFGPGVKSMPIDVLVIADNTPESDDVFYVNLINFVNAKDRDHLGQGLILNDDGAPTTFLSIDNVQLVEGDSGTTNAVFTVTRTGDLGVLSSINYETVDGTAAVANLDYTATNGTLNFGDGDSSHTISVPVTGDTVGEDFESFTVKLSDPTGAGIADDIGLGTILNDDTEISISDDTVTEGDQAVFTVSLSYPSVLPVTVDFTTVDDTATAGVDYTTASGTRTFAPGQTTRTILVQTLVDGDSESGDEMFTVVLSADEDQETHPINAIIDVGIGTGAIMESGATTTTTYDSTDVTKRIRDLKTVTSTLYVPDSITISDINVQLDITHSIVSDLHVALIAPDGTRIRLFTQVGVGAGKDFIGTILDDEAATPISLGSAPFTGSFRPEERLSTFDGMNALGDWTLEIKDVLKGAPGRLNSWSITIVPAPALASSASATDAALLAWVAYDSSDEDETDILTTTLADDLALMLVE